MLQLDQVCKSYATGTFVQVALDHVSLAFRDNEFVSILGPSGSGKTTLLNVIGGLDHFDGGDLVIDGISTREYRDRDWDAYRNNRIGFVFQSYNLIPHQTILANVELALTLSGVSPAERRTRAQAALAKVGLAEHVDKRPSQLSGGQMQRVAIARALINDPEILLADEPTGALDSRTSVQVMDLLREVASDRLVIMVTHNPELAEQYSTRIVELADGRIRTDSNPFVPTAADLRDAKPPRLTSMGFLTALSLSFNNLMTKKGRTLMTAFAGSIGIIGIAAILSLANGVNAYIQEVEEKTLSVYPLQIMSSGFDMTSMIVDMQTEVDAAEADKDEAVADDPSSPTIHEMRMVTNMFSSMGKNDLASLKAYLDDDGGGISSSVQSIEYLYGVVPQIFADDPTGEVRQVNPDSTFASLGFGGSSSAIMSSSSAFSTNVFSQMPGDTSMFDDQFDIRAGRWPEAYNELVLVLNQRGAITDFVSYAMGLRDPEELKRMVQQFADQEEVVAPTDERTYSLDQLMGVTFRIVPASSFYVHEQDYGVWTDKSDDAAFMADLLSSAPQLKVVGVVQTKEDVDATSLNQGIYYTPALTRWLMEQAAASEIVRQQQANPAINVISGKSFDQEADESQSDFDMSSLFSVDEDKLKSAFGMDALGMDASGMDASSFDLDGLDLTSLLGSIDLGELMTSFDASSVSIPTIDLSSLPQPQLSMPEVQLDLQSLNLGDIDLIEVFEPDLLAILMTSRPSFRVKDLFEGVSLESSLDYEKVGQALIEVQEGLGPYLVAHPVDITDSEAVRQVIRDYYSEPLVTERLRRATDDAFDLSQANRDIIAQNLKNELAGIELTAEEAEQLDLAQQRLLRLINDNVGFQVARQLSDQISQELSNALSTTLSTIYEDYLGQVVSALVTGALDTLETKLKPALEGIAGQVMGQLMKQMMSSMADSFTFDEQAFAEAFTFNMDQQELSELMMALMTTERTSYDGNLTKLGFADASKPAEIDIYPLNFEEKSQIINILDDYNERMRAEGSEDKVVTYTDLVGALMSSVTDIVNMISYVLIAFVAISLVVSSIMIGVITYISVLERKKEIGILRSIGASKRDVSRVFNAETVIEGLVSGIMGVGLTALLCIPVNIIVETTLGVVRVARLPLGAACILVGVSVLLSFVAGLLPSRKAAKADPVEALRSE